MLALFSGGAAGSSAVVFSHWLALLLTLPLALFSAATVLRRRGWRRPESAAAVLGAALVLLNPVYNLLEDEAVVAPRRTVAAAVNALTWAGIGLSTAATVVAAGLHVRAAAWWRGETAPEVVCER